MIHHPSEFFTYEGNETFFKIGAMKYKIPSPLFPISLPDKMQVFCAENTKHLHHPEIESIFNLLEFQEINAYENAKSLFSLAKNRGFALKYYSGWVFAGASFPIHHAWCVYKGNILDGSILKNLHTLMMEVYQNAKTQSMDFVKALNRKILAIKDSGEANADLYIYGKLPENYTYIGSPDTADNATDTFKELIREYPQHPSYDGSNKFSGHIKM